MKVTSTMRRLGACLILCLALPVCMAPGYAQPGEQVDTVRPAQDALLARFEERDLEFLRLRNEELKIVSFFHQRKIGEAIVEKDFIRYMFNAETGELIEDARHWRQDLPARLPALISQRAAESAAEGAVQHSRLYYISPQSEVFPIQPPPRHPCWVVSSRQGERLLITVIDAVTGEKLGYGIPPPAATGLSMHGPDWGACPQDPIWYDWAESARSWFTTMGYSTTRIGNASEADVRSRLQTDSLSMFYELDHGGSWSFHNRCDSDIDAGEIRTWVNSYANMPFTFLGSCDGMCDLTANHFSFEFRKGSTTDTVTVGYCGMSSTACDACWGNSRAWQNTLFSRMNSGDTVWTAFGVANATWPNCPAGNCMRFAGDTTLVVKPVVTRSLCGTLANPLPPYLYVLAHESRDHYIRCDITAGGSAGVAVTSGTTLVFLNNSKVTASSPFSANGSGGEIRLVSESDRSKGMKLTGQVRAINGGQIRIFE